MFSVHLDLFFQVTKYKSIQKKSRDVVNVVETRTFS